MLTRIFCPLTPVNFKALKFSESNKVVPEEHPNYKEPEKIVVRDFQMAEVSALDGLIDGWQNHYLSEELGLSDADIARHGEADSLLDHADNIGRIEKDNPFIEDETDPDRVSSMDGFSVVQRKSSKNPTGFGI